MGKSWESVIGYESFLNTNIFEKYTNGWHCLVLITSNEMKSEYNERRFFERTRWTSEWTRAIRLNFFFKKDGSDFRLIR